MTACVSNRVLCMVGDDVFEIHKVKKHQPSECNKPMVSTNQSAAFIAYCNMGFV